MSLELVAFDERTGVEIKPGADIETFRGDPVKFIEATRERAYGRSGKVLVEHPNGIRQEYYDKTMNIRVGIVDRDDTQTFTIQQIASYVSRHARNLERRVQQFKIHPSYDSRADLKASMNSLSGMFSLMLEMNQYKEIEGSDVRSQVTKARRAVESLYKKSDM